MDSWDKDIDINICTWWSKQCTDDEQFKNSVFSSKNMSQLHHRRWYITEHKLGSATGKLS